jgi:hypothetical protein
MVVGLSSCGEGPGSSDSAMSGRTAAGRSDPGATVPESVPAYPFRLVGDSVRIEVRVGSDPLKLRAVDLDGNELGSEYLDLPDMAAASSPPDSSAPIRWELPPSP